MFRLAEPNKEEYVVFVPREYFGMFDLFYTDAGYKAISGEPLDNFANNYSYFYINKTDKTICFSEINLRQEEEYGLMELIEKVNG